MNQVKVSRTHYHEMSPTLLGTFALGVRDGVYINNPGSFPPPPVTQVIFEGIIEDYEEKRTAYVNGGSAQKGPYTTALDLLMTTLDDLADMVDDIPNLTVAIVLQAGFTSTKESDSEHHVPDGSLGNVTLKRGASTGVITSECSVVPEAEFYHAILSTMLMPLTRIDDSKRLEIAAGETFVLVDVSKSRKKTFEGLTAGSTYYVYYFIGNAKGVSQLTEVKSIMCA
jgi:hypothetical protein